MVDRREYGPMEQEPKPTEGPATSSVPSLGLITQRLTEQRPDGWYAIWLTSPMPDGKVA